VEGEVKDSSAGADSVNLMGILIPGERAHAVPGRVFVIKSNMLEQSSSNVPKETNLDTGKSSNSRIERRPHYLTHDHPAPVIESAKLFEEGVATLDE